MKRGILIVLIGLVGCACSAGAWGHSSKSAGGASWPDLVQKPYEGLPTPDIGLKPLLLTRDGQAVTTPEAWERQRRALRTAWLQRLGEPPPRPESLDIQVQSRDLEPDHVLQRVSF